jgi:PilZ domain
MRSEKRRSPRFGISQFVTIGFGRETFLHADALNISRLGLLCTTEQHIDPGTRIFLSLVLEGDERINCEAVVTRSMRMETGFQVAMSLVEFSPEDSEKFNGFMLRLEADPRHQANHT